MTAAAGVDSLVGKGQQSHLCTEDHGNSWGHASMALSAHHSNSSPCPLPSPWSWPTQLITCSCPMSLILCHLCSQPPPKPYLPAPDTAYFSWDLPQMFPVWSLFLNPLIPEAAPKGIILSLGLHCTQTMDTHPYLSTSFY